MKYLSLIIICLFATVFLQAQVSKSVNISPGGLSSALTATEKSTVTNLTVTGAIDARDFKTMRNDMPVLAVLDLSSLTVVTYTGTEGTFSTSNTTYPANTVPDNTFFTISTHKGKTSLTSVLLPSSVTSIGEYAFCGCSGLTSIIIPSLVTNIGNFAFTLCSGLTSITIPTSVTSVGKDAFIAYNGSITVDVGNQNYSSIDGVFFNKAQTTLLKFPTSKTGSYLIPSSVTSIGEYAFAGCNGLTAVTIPSSVTFLGDGAFSGYSGLMIVYNNNLNYSSLDGVLFNKTQTTLIQYPTSKKGSYIIPSSVTSIGNNTFNSCSGLNSVTIPSSVTSIGKNAFLGCIGLVELTIPSSVTSIGEGAFNSCKGLNSVTIPSSVTSIGNYVFLQCIGLTSVTIPSSVISIGEAAFEQCSSLPTVTIPSSVTSIGGFAFGFCTSLASIKVEITTPLDLSSSLEVFYQVNKTACTLYVPVGSKSVYQTANQWKDFRIIEEFSTNDVKVINSDEIGVYPNPVEDGFHVSGIKETSTLSVFDTNGKQLLTKEIECNEYVSVNSLPPGVYIVRINSKAGTIEKKIVKK